MNLRTECVAFGCFQPLKNKSLEFVINESDLEH